MSSMVMALATVAKAGVNFLHLILITSTPIVFAALATEIVARTALGGTQECNAPDLRAGQVFDALINKVLAAAGAQRHSVGFCYCLEQVCHAGNNMSRWLALQLWAEIVLSALDPAWMRARR